MNCLFLFYHLTTWYLYNRPMYVVICHYTWFAVKNTKKKKCLALNEALMKWILIWTQQNVYDHEIVKYSNSAHLYKMFILILFTKIDFVADCFCSSLFYFKMPLFIRKALSAMKWLARFHLPWFLNLNWTWSVHYFTSISWSSSGGWSWLSCHLMALMCETCHMVTDGNSQ